MKNNLDFVAALMTTVHARNIHYFQRWSRGHKARGQGQGHKKISRPRTDPLKAKDQRHRRKCSPKKKVLKFFFQAISKKKVFKNFFQAEKVFKYFFSGDLCLRKPKIRSLQIFRKVLGVFQRNFNGSKIVLSSSRGQGNFRGHEASRPRPRTLKCVLEDSTSDYFALCIGLVLMQPINYFAAYYYTGASVKGEQL